MGWRDAPVAQPPQAAPQQPQAPRAWQNAPSAMDMLKGMSREEMIDYYRTSRKGDPVADEIERILSQPMAGESPEDTQGRLYGRMDPATSNLQAGVAGATDALGMGGADELAGMIGGAKSWWQGDGYQRGYDESLDKARRTLSTARQEHPGAYIGGQVGGGLAQGLLMGPTGAAQGLGGRVLAGAGMGATEGGLYGFLSGENGLGERLKNSGMGAGIGAGVGAAFPVLGAGLGWLRGRWKDKGVDAKALGKVADMLEDTTMTPQEAQSVAARQGPHGMIADVNEGMQVATGGTSAAGGAGVIGPPLANRRAGAKERVLKSLDEGFGRYVGPQTVKDAIADVRKPAGPAYELAKTHIVDPEDALAKISELQKTYGPNSSLGQSLQKYQAQLVDGAGNVVGQGNIVHGVREQLDDEINGLYRNGLPKAAERLKEVRREIDKVLKAQIPGFEEADRVWAETARIDEAYKYGKDEVLGRVHPGEVKARVDKMTVPEVSASRAGVRDEIEMRMSQPSVNPGSRAERILDSNMNREKLNNYTTPQRADRLAQDLDNEMTFNETSNLAEPSRQSRTAPVGLSAQKYWGKSRGSLGDAAIDVAAGAGAGFALGGPHGAMVGGLGAATSKMREAIASMLASKPSQELLNKTSEMLVRQGPERDRLIADIIRRSNNKLTKAQAGRALDSMVRMLGQGMGGAPANSIAEEMSYGP